jgi:putative FmdB family regulatory protein
MPLYEYVCEQCRHPFEALVRSGEVPACPACGATRLAKQLSVFAVSGGDGAMETAMPAGGCGTCGDPRGPGACARD